MEKVLFACTHNAGRSQMAAAFFNASVNSNKARAISAGTNPGERVHPEVELAMKEAGIDLSGVQPQRLTPSLADGASFLITMGCEETCPVVIGAKVENWALEDPKGKSIEHVRSIRDDIHKRVQALIEANGWL